MDRYVVTPSINVEGANDSASHRRRVPAVSGGARRRRRERRRCDAARRPRTGLAEARLTAHAVSSAATIAYATFQIAVWRPSGIIGSNRIGNASSAAKLPTLLAAYSQ